MKKTNYSNNKIKLINVLDLYKCLTELLYESTKDADSQMREVKYPAKVSYAINKNLRLLVPIVSEFEIKKQGIVEKFGGKPDNEKKMFVYDTPEQEKDSNTEIMTLVNEEYDVNIHKITLDMLGDAMISPEKISSLEDLGMLEIDSN